MQRRNERSDESLQAVLSVVFGCYVVEARLSFSMSSSKGRVPLQHIQRVASFLTLVRSPRTMIEY